MKETIQQFLLVNLDFLPPELIVIIVSAFPILELRGGIPLAFGFGFSLSKTLSLCLFGNFLPIIPMLILFKPISTILLKYSWYNKYYSWLYNQTIKKSSNVKKYGALGLILFTAIPLPTTGAYSASIAASLMAIPFKYSLPAIFIGVIIAGLGVGFAIFSFF
ncbi:MAG: small multi-drug export protein [Eubacteriales bacterium]